MSTPRNTLADLLERVIDTIDTISDGAAYGAITPDQFQAEVTRSLFAAYNAAWMAARDSREIDRADRLIIAERLATQIEYLNNFADQIEQEGWQDKFKARAELYAGSVKAVFWQAMGRGILMPYWPGDGSTPCKMNCRCHLEYAWIDQDNLDVDVYWRHGRSRMPCSSCPQRAAASPYRFREGVLQ